MSAIFGYSYHNGCSTIREDALQVLDLWNRPYGAEASDHVALGNSGIGCRIEHFSRDFPWGDPILEQEGKYAAVDALLYNRDELFTMLDLAPDTPISDEELLLQLIRQQGFDALAQVNGDFSGAIYDPAAGQWTLFRDHLGVRPLYYYLDDTLFSFSTDIRGTAALCGDKCRPCEAQLYEQFMGYNSLTLCRTDYDNVFCVTPGSIMTVRADADGFRREERLYWQLRRKKIRMASEEAYTQELRRLVTDSVRRRLDAVPGIVGAELSGGLDSSVISILIHRLGRDACYYSWSQSPDSLPLRKGVDERKVILDICRQEDVTCRFHDQAMHLELQDLLQDAYPSHTDTYKLTFGSRWMHSQGARVVFTGHGGDEGISHRCHPYELLHNREYMAFLRLYWGFTKGRKLRLLRTIKWSVCDAIAFYKKFSAGYQDALDENHSILAEEFRNRMRPTIRQRKLFFHFSPCDYVNQGGTRQRMDNAAFQGAASGVRYLFPYVDHRVMDFAVSIPRHLFIGPDRDRKIFRDAFKDMVPKSLYDVNYKDYASKRDQKPTAETLKSLESLLEVRPLLDRDYWSGILDFDTINALNVPTSTDPTELSKFITLTAQLRRCLLIQNIRDQAKQGSEPHE